MCVTWKRNVLLETAVLVAERWIHLTYSNEPNLLQTFASLLATAAGSWQCGWRTEAPSNGLRRRERTTTRQKTDSHVDFLNLKVDIIYKMDSKVGFEMSLIVVEAIRGRCASFMSLPATVSEIFGGQTNPSILVV